MPAPILNGVTIYPTDAPKAKTKVGRMQETANGGKNFIHRITAVGTPIYKSTFVLDFKNITEARRAALEALYNVATNVTYVDQHGTSYTVVCPDDGYSDSIALIQPDGTLYYNVSLSLIEV